jgi:hypothetical protein
MERHPITLKGLVYLAPGAENVRVDVDLPYVAASGDTLAFDVYYPAGDGPHPTVLIVNGYNDVGGMERLGCRFKDMQSYIEWGRNFAASGLATVFYSNQNAVPDLAAIMKHLQAHATNLHLDLSRLGIYATSGHSPVALTLLRADAPLRVSSAALLCPMIGEGTNVDDLQADIPLFIARAGKDETPGLNVALDRFVADALARNLPITILNHPEAPHAFDLFMRGFTSTRVLRALVEFMRLELSASR